jgi:hypothetical protein
VSATLTGTAPASKIGQAQAIRREVMEASWPKSREAEAAIGWKLGELLEILAVRDRLLNDDLDPYEVRAPDTGCSWDLETALEYVDYEAAQIAEGLRKRFAEYRERERRTWGPWRKAIHRVKTWFGKRGTS